VLNEARRAARIQRSRLTARKLANKRTTNSGSDPPKHERCIHSKLSTAKKPAIQPPHNRNARTVPTTDESKQTKSNDARSEMRVTVETAEVFDEKSVEAPVSDGCGHVDVRPVVSGIIHHSEEVREFREAPNRKHKDSQRCDGQRENFSLRGLAWGRSGRKSGGSRRI
jgi:hypothetical protein